MKTKRIVAVAAVVLIVGLVVKMPASVLLHWALPEAVQTSGISGSIWRGHVDAVAVASVNAGPVDWQLHPFTLLTGKLAATLQAELPGGFADGRVALRGDRIWLEDTKLAVDLGQFTRYSSIGPSTGRARIDIQRAELRDLWPAELVAEMTVNNLAYPGVGTAPLGNYQLVFPETNNGDSSDINGTLTALDSAPYELDGTLTLSADRGYALRGLIAAKSGVNAAYSRGLQFLGPADSEGRRQLVFEGTL
ncbi:MAG: type II secretion system protein N [Pseudomonadota bacterium]